jgi:hypothetical protein
MGPPNFEQPNQNRLWETVYPSIVSELFRGRKYDSEILGAVGQGSSSGGCTKIGT